MHASQPAGAPPRSPANLLGLDYRRLPELVYRGPIIDAHTHVYSGPQARVFFEAASLYGIQHVVSMTPLAEVEELRRDYGDRLSFIAIPNWKLQDRTETFRDQWMADLVQFRGLGAKLCKFWMAPPMRERHGLTLAHEFTRPVIDRALDLGFEFMVHVGDPSVWWKPGARYADTAKFGTKHEQYPPLEWFLDFVAPRRVIGAHMGGFIEAPDFLNGLLDRHPNLHLDCSATKWIVREVSGQPQAIHDFVVRNSARILFGSDLVANDKFHDFDHYASRYWAHRVMWETPYRGLSPIEDPDAEQPPQLAGVSLPLVTLERVFHANAVRFGLLPE